MLCRLLLGLLFLMATLFPTLSYSAHAQAFQKRLDHAQTLVRKIVTEGDRQQKLLADVKSAETSFELASALDPIILADISINPESRVKIAARPSRVAMVVGKPQRLLLKIENLAGSTAPLQVMSIDLAVSPPAKPSWLEIRIVDNDWTSNLLSGDESEYKVVELTLHDAGLHEVRLAAEAGQGTQDLGFRATTDLLLEGQASTP